MDIPARIGRSLHRIGDRRHLDVFRGFVGAVDLHQLDGIARSDLHDVALLRPGQRLGKLTREGRERQNSHLAAIGSRSVVNRILGCGCGKITALPQGRQQAVGQRLLRVGQHDVADADRVGRHLRIQHAGHRPLVVLQYGTVHLTVHQRLRLLVGELRSRHVALGDPPVAVRADERTHLLRGGELLADLGCLVFQSQQVVVRGRHLEDHIRKRPRRSLLELILMAVVVGFQVRRRHGDNRIGNRRILLAGPFAREGLVRALDALRNFQRIDVHAALHQSVELLKLAFQTRLLVELGPHLRSLCVRLGLRQELVHGLHVVLPRARIRKGRIEGLRGLLTADHRQTLRLRHTEPHASEARSQHVVGNQRLPYGIRQHGRLLLVALLDVVLRLDLLVTVVVFRIVDLLAVDHPDARIIARKSHLGFQGEDECQERQCDDDRKHDAELGP